LLSRISQVKRTAPGPLLSHPVLPTFVIGTVIR
jgi:hypothetical protein